jgi:hypothetical protein
MTTRQQRRAAERAQRKQARREARQTITSTPHAPESAKGGDARHQAGQELANSLGGAPSAQPVGGVVRGSMGAAPVLRVPQQARASINRENAKHSTGPKTVAGKANSSRNSFKHGLYSKQLVTSDEEASALDSLKADLRNEHQPINETEEILVNEMAEQFWRIRRARAFEATVLDNGNIILAHLTAAQRMMTSAERGFHKALATLRQFQKECGFVPQNRGSFETAPVSNNLPGCDCQGADAIGFESQSASDPGPRTTDHGQDEAALCQRAEDSNKAFVSQSTSACSIQFVRQNAPCDPIGFVSQSAENGISTCKLEDYKLADLACVS